MSVNVSMVGLGVFEKRVKSISSIGASGEKKSGGETLCDSLDCGGRRLANSIRSAIEAFFSGRNISWAIGGGLNRSGILIFMKSLREFSIERQKA